LAKGKIHNLKAVSNDYTCAILTDTTGTTSGVIVAKFVSTNDETVEDLVTSSLIDTAANGDLKKYQVANSCTALSMNVAAYTYYAAGTPSKFIADTVPVTPWVNPVFDATF